MATFDPWDETPSKSPPKRKFKLRKPQSSMASSLKSNILNDHTGLSLSYDGAGRTKPPSMLVPLLGKQTTEHLKQLPINRKPRSFCCSQASRLIDGATDEQNENIHPNNTNRQQISPLPRVNAVTNHSTSPKTTPKALDVSFSQACHEHVTKSPYKIKEKNFVRKMGSFMTKPFVELDVINRSPNKNDSPESQHPESDVTTMKPDIDAVLGNVHPLTPPPPPPSMSDLSTNNHVSVIATESRRPRPIGNYIKLNLRKKCFSRFGMHRQNKAKFQIRREKFVKKFGVKDASKGTCFKCHQKGHWASKCPANISKQPTDSEIAEMEPDYRSIDWRIGNLVDLQRQFSTGPQLNELLNYDLEAAQRHVPVELISSKFNAEEVSAFMSDLLRQMGIQKLRPGQERAIWRTIRGKSTLVVLPTAGGKSLCYQLPSAIIQKYNPSSTALVISPLISLMQDQVPGMASPIRGNYLSSGQTREEKEEILEAANRGQYAYILVSPEALVESEWILSQNRLPSISFVCIDEAHCLADWSHHFRPSYLQICNLIRNRLGVKQFLGLSATCTPSTIQNICYNLGMSNASKLCTNFDAQNPLLCPEPDSGYIQPFSGPLPSNLVVTASMDINREEALISLLQRPPFSEQLSILIYATSRDLTERLSGYIRTALQGIKQKIGRRIVGWNTAVYHAGLSSKERARVQKNFMAGRIRVLVATTAFGMGLNKRDLQAVIHFSLPKSFENYIQEIGRVGRNGQQSYCHTFLSPGFSVGQEAARSSTTLTPEEAREANDLRRHIFANHIDAIQLKRLLRLVFADTNDRTKCGHVVALDPDQVAEQLDIQPKSLATLLTYMHMRTDSPPSLTLLPQGPLCVNINCYGGPRELARVSNRCLAVSAWLGYLKSLHPTTFTTASLREVTIDLVTLCNILGWRPDAVYRELRGLEWDSVEGSAPRRTGVIVSLSGANRASWLWVHDDQIAGRLDEELNYLRRRLEDVESAGLRSLAQLQSVITLVAFKSVEDIKFDGDQTIANSTKLHEQTRVHFSEGGTDCPPVWPSSISVVKELSVRRTVSEFLQLHGNSLGGQLTGRVLANIFHGIGSPAFPALAWSRAHQFWRAHLDVDWPAVKRIATEELIQSAAAFA